MPGLAPALHAYQAAALEWMLQREQRRDSLPAAEALLGGTISDVRGGVLADEMGLGKTVTVAALVLAAPENDAAPKAGTTRVALRLGGARLPTTTLMEKPLPDPPKGPRRGGVRAVCVCGDAVSEGIECAFCGAVAHKACSRAASCACLGSRGAPSENGLVKSRATLVVCPAAIAGQWKGELARHAPSLIVAEYPGVQALQKAARAARRQVDAPRTCPGSPLFAHDRVQALVVNVLYVWAVKHPASGYVQGMNDLLAVFLVVLVDEVSEGDHVDVATLSDDVLDDVAADAYGLLNGVLESLDDHYVHRQPGLQRTIEEVDGLLRRVDADLHKHLDEVGVLLLQVTFRWINCLLVRELPMRCAIRLWDTCLAEERGFRTFFPYVCAAFLCHFSDALKAKPTEDVHLFLTSLPTSNWADDEVETLLSEAYILSTLFRSAPAHLQHEPDGITPCGGFL